MRIRLERVEYMPQVFQPGVLYYAEEFGAAAHLCPCGCGHKVQTPVGASDYTLRVDGEGPTLFPSIGNWQRPCQSHYWIRSGGIVWDEPWSPERIAAGRAAEAARDRAHFEARRRTHDGPIDRTRGGSLERLWRWIKSLFES